MCDNENVKITENNIFEQISDSYLITFKDLKLFFSISDNQLYSLLNSLLEKGKIYEPKLDMYKVL